MATTRKIISVALFLLSFNLFDAQLVAQPRSERAGVSARKSEKEAREERARRLRELEKAVEKFDTEANDRWEQFTKQLEKNYERSFSEAMEGLLKKSSSRLHRLNDLSRMNVVKKLPKVAAHVHEEIAPKVHEQAKQLFQAFVQAEVKLVAEFQRRLADEFPELMRHVVRKVRNEERKEQAAQDDAMLLAWAAYCKAQMVEALPQSGESYNTYFGRMNARYWGIMRSCTEQYLARLSVSNEVYRTRLTAFNQAYWASIERSTARYSAYISMNTQLYFNRMAMSSQLYASYIRNSTQNYVNYVQRSNSAYRDYIQRSNQAYLSYIQRSNQAYLNYINRSNQMYWDYINFWTAIYYKRLGLI